MACNAFSFYSNVFGIITGSISLATLAFGFQSYLPSKRIKTLENLLEDTDQILSSAVEDGMLTEPRFRAKAYDSLSVLRRDASTLRSRAYCATTWTQDLKELFMGLSFRIGETCRCLKKLRAEIVTSSEAERRNICAARHATSPASSNDHEISPIDRSDSLDGHADSAVTSMTIPEPIEADVAECNKCEDEFKVFAEPRTEYQSYDPEETTGRLKLHGSGADQCCSMPTDAVEAVAYDHVGGVDEPIPRVILPVKRFGPDRTLHQTVLLATLDLGGHGQPQVHSAKHIPS